VSLAVSSPQPTQERGSRSKGRVPADRWGDIPARLVHLIATVHPEGRKPWSPAEIARGINEAAEGDKKLISEIFIQKIITGERPSPTLRYLELIAGFFQVPVGYFLDDETTQAAPIDQQQLTDLATLRDPTVRKMLRHYVRLSEAARSAVLDITMASLRAEGKTVETEDQADPS
jgi:ESX-1-secreted protein regulator